MAATFNINSFINSFNSKIEEPVRQHLKNVYGCLTLSTLAAAGGAGLHYYMDIGGFLSAIGALICVGILMTTPDNGKNTPMRMALLFGFAGLSGVGMGPLIQHVIAFDPSIVITALLATTLIFVSFTMCALFSRSGQWLYLGGILMSMLNVMVLMALGNLFFGSTMIYQVHLYMGLFLMCGFVLYDTQLIVEKRRMGNQDFVAHSLDLFVDFIGIFRRILIILTQKEENARRKRKD